MILTCPSCGTQYVVKDGAIPPAGRQVRCASCKYSWHQEPDEEPTLELQEEAPTDARAQDEPEVSEELASFDNGSQEQSDPAFSPEPRDTGSVPQDDDVENRRWFPDQEDEFGPFGAREEYAEERRRSPLLKLLIIVLLVAALAAAFWFLAPPEWKARLGVAEASGTPLQLKLTKTLREPLESGNDLVTVSGGIINPTAETQNVPRIRAELRKKSGEMVHSWTISPPARRLAPGGTAPFNSAEVNVPREGDELTISFAGSKA